jgi:uncharacterized protein YggE
MRRLTVLFVSLMAVCVVASAQTGSTEPSSIVVQGIATLKVAPDQAWASVAVEARDGKAAEARKRAAAQMSTVQAALKATGLPADALKTANFSLQPQMEWVDAGKMRVKEYVLRNEIDVRVDNLDLLGDVLDAAGSVKTAGSLSVAIGNVRFELKDRKSSEQEAIRVAVRDAMSRAQAMAEGAGRSLGPILRIEEQRIIEEPQAIPALLRMPPGYPMDLRNGPGAGGARGGGQAGQLASPQTPFEPNSIEIRARVMVTVAIR